MEITRNRYSATPTHTYERIGLELKWKTKNDSYGFGFSFCDSINSISKERDWWFRIWIWNFAIIFEN